MPMLFRISVLIYLLVPTLAPAFAQEPAAPVKPPTVLEQRQQERDKREADLRAVEGAIRQSDSQKQRAIKEVEQLRGDRTRLNKELIDTTARVRITDESLSLIEGKLGALERNEIALRGSLDARRDVMAEVLAALQRMGRKPPPAVLVHPDDILAAVRASIMLGDVLPELRAEAELLARDLEALVLNRKDQEIERDASKREKEVASADRDRLAALISSRQSQLESTELQLREERQKITSLAREVQTLKELIARMETDIAGAAKAAEAAKRVPLPGNPANRDDAFKDAARLAPKVAFADLRGALALPTAGTIVKTYGSADGYGGVEKGITIMPPSGAIVAAPNDGWIAFSGPYRSYGQVLIVNAGNGYHIVLIGIDHTLVDVGQFVLAGEPIAVMAQRDASSLKSDLPQRGSTLYIELRKDGLPIDSGPWWSQQLNEKARG